MAAMFNSHKCCDVFFKSKKRAYELIYALLEMHPCGFRMSTNYTSILFLDSIVFSKMRTVYPHSIIASCERARLGNFTKPNKFPAKIESIFFIISTGDGDGA